MPRVPLSVPSTALVLYSSHANHGGGTVLYPASASNLNADGIDDSKSRTRSGGSGATHVIVIGFYLCRPTLRWLSVNYRVDIKPRHIEA